MSVSIDDVKLRNKQFLDANGHAGKSASVVSTTPSGASKSDSGIRSDEEVESCPVQWDAVVLLGSGSHSGGAPRGRGW